MVQPPRLMPTCVILRSLPPSRKNSRSPVTKGGSTVVKWDAVPGATLYTVMWQQGSGSGAPFSQSGTTSALTYSVNDSLNRVRVQATVGSWTTSFTEKICN